MKQAKLGHDSGLIALPRHSDYRRLMRIATWNVNSVKARLPNVLAWLESTKPDVLLLQEIKCETPAFPRLEFEQAGYQVYAKGQKSYNGVAIISRHNAEGIVDCLPGDPDDVQERYIEATIKGVRIASIYLPNGNPIDTDKYPYKLNWIKRLTRHAATLLASEQPVVLGGDYNVIPSPQDVYNPEAWGNDALFHPHTREAWQRLLATGYTEAFRALHPHQRHAYTFWDYQAGSWQRDNGLRIDHFLLSPEAVDRLTGCVIDKAPRGQEKASDHTPVILTMD